MRIDEIFKPNEYEPVEKDFPQCLRLTDEVCEKYASQLKRYKSEAYKFENRVFIHLFKSKIPLGIAEVYRLDNCRVDGLLELDSAQVILLEIKYALNWQTACNARVELQRFFEEKQIQQYFGEKHYPDVPRSRPTRALIIFRDFSLAWERGNPWRYFYGEESLLRGKIPVVPIDIVQFDEIELIPASEDK